MKVGEIMITLGEVKTMRTIPAGTPILAWGYQATVVAHRPDLGGYVVAMAGEDGTMPGEQWVTPEDDLEEPAATTCGTCGYNLPYHEVRCPERNISPLALALELVNMSDADSDSLCAACGHRFGHAMAKIADGQLIHRDLDCTRPGVWS
jgi:hypothetical protein